MNLVAPITRVLSLPAAYRAFSQLVAKDHWKGVPHGICEPPARRKGA